MRDKRSCAGRVYGGRDVRGYSCSINAAIQRGGVWWCHVHDPERVKARREARDKAYQVKQDQNQDTQNEGISLLRRLGVNGSVECSGLALQYVRRVGINFSEVEKLLVELGR